MVRTYLKAVWHAQRPAAGLIASTGFAVLSPRRGTFPKFVSYVCQGDPFTNRVTAESVGVAYPAIPETRLGTFEVSVPPFPEQTAIARFLDHANDRIDRCIRAKKKLIALLEEQKQILIHDAVTGRFDVRTGQAYPAYKPSGVEWLGEVPAHWKVMRLKTWLDINKLVLPEDTHLEYTFDYLDIGSVATGRLAAKPDRIQFGNSPSRARRVVRPGDTLISMVRTYLKAVWHAQRPAAGLIASTGFAVLSPRRGTFPKFVSYVCQGDPFTNCVTAESVGVAYPAIPETRLGTFEVSVPPFPEQIAIASYLDSAIADIANTIDRAKRQIRLLREYRTRLIADVVTGKLDVREAAADLPEPKPVSDHYGADTIQVDSSSPLPETTSLKEGNP